MTMTFVGISAKRLEGESREEWIERLSKSLYERLQAHAQEEKKKPPADIDAISEILFPRDITGV